MTKLKPITHFKGEVKTGNIKTGALVRLILRESEFLEYTGYFLCGIRGYVEKYEILKRAKEVSG